MIKVIRISGCFECPHHGKCSAWKSLTRGQRVTLTISNNIPHDMMLKNCPLDDETPTQDNCSVNDVERD